MCVFCVQCNTIFYHVLTQLNKNNEYDTGREVRQRRRQQDRNVDDDDACIVSFSICFLNLIGLTYVLFCLFHTSHCNNIYLRKNWKTEEFGNAHEWNAKRIRLSFRSAYMI